MDCHWILAQATSACSKKVSPIAPPVLKILALFLNLLIQFNLSDDRAWHGVISGGFLNRINPGCIFLLYSCNINPLPGVCPDALQL